MLSLQHNSVHLSIVNAGGWFTLPDGTRGSPAEAGWSNDDGYALVPYVAPEAPPVPDPTPEEVRAEMSALTQRQLRLTLLTIGITEAQVDAALVNDPVGIIEWRWASYFKRTHPLIDALGALFSLTPEQIDDLWVYAAAD